MNAQLKRHDQILFDEWDHLVRHSPQGSCYALSHYLEIVSPGWHGIEVWQGERLVAVMPLPLRYRSGIGFSLQGPFTQYGGPVFDREALEKVQQQGAYKSLSWQRKVTQAMVGAIPGDVLHCSHCLSPAVTDALPFHWAGYQLRSRTTYHLSTSPGENALWQGLANNTRYEIRKAAALELRESRSAHQLLRLTRLNRSRGKALMSEKEEAILSQLADNLLHFGDATALELWEQDHCLAAGLFVHFGSTWTYLASAQDPDARRSGATTRLVWEAILRCQSTGGTFDFEGSMKQGIEGFFRGFGALPVAYLHIEKNKLPLLLRWIKNLR